MSARGREDGTSATPSLALGYLAALPLFLAYELALALEPESLARASVEALVARGLAPLGPRAQAVRAGILLVLAGLALVRCRHGSIRTEQDLVPTLARRIGLGILAGVLLGPLLAGLVGWLGAGSLVSAPERTRALVPALRLVGAAPWEELVFRVGLYGGLFLLVRRSAAFLGLHTGPSLALAELAALLASAVLFALFHLDAVQRLLGGPGEVFHRGLFLWRVSAGILLGALFRWRGFGVAAWAHAVFNLGIALGLGP